MILDGAAIIANASIRSSQPGKVAYVADALEQALLLPEDMTGLRQMRKYEVFLTLKKELALVKLLASSSLLFVLHCLFVLFLFCCCLYI